MKNLGDKIEALHNMREEKRSLEAHVKLIAAQMEEMKEEIIAMLDAAGLDRGASSSASVTIKENEMFNISDRDAFFAYVHRYKYYHLLENRAARAACSELYAKKGKIPGITPYIKRDLNLRAL